MSDRITIPFTNEHFAAWCLSMLGQPYWFGTCAYKATSSLLKSKTAQYPSHYGANRTASYKRDIAAKSVVCDCIGAVKGYMWTGGGQGVLEAIGTGKTFTSKYGSNGCPDKGANAMFTYAKSKGAEWGEIDTLPEIVGVALHKSGHVGYYVGDGYAVEWKGYSHGCIKTKVAGRGWTHWYKLPFIDYCAVPASNPDQPPISIPDPPPAPADLPVKPPDPATLRNLSYTPGMTMLRGEDVRALQEGLNKLGFDCGDADGIFRLKTDAAVRAFQRAKKLEVDGIVGPKTRAALDTALQPTGEQTGATGVETPPEPDEHAQGETQAGEGQADEPGKEPVTIRIRMIRPENIAVYGTREIALDIEEYLSGVVPSEMYESAHIEALKAQAICARTYALYRKHNVISDTSSHQSFHAGKIGKNPRSDTAITATRGMILTYGGTVKYSAQIP